MITQKQKNLYSELENCYLLVKRQINYDYIRGRLNKDEIILITKSETVDDTFIVNFITSDLKNDKFKFRGTCLLLTNFSNYFEVLE